MKQTQNFKIPEYININERTIYFSDMKDITEINKYLDMIEKLQTYDPNIIMTSRRNI
jgi:hypothetical protein